MPASTPIPGRLNPEAPENGYESPGLLEEAPVFFSDLDMVNSGEERRRTGYNGRDDVADTERSNSRTGTSPQTSNRADEEKAAKDIEAGTGGVGKVGFRDRIACYTWTWFTMNMATGMLVDLLRSCRSAFRLEIYAQRLEAFQCPVPYKIFVDGGIRNLADYFFLAGGIANVINGSKTIQNTSPRPSPDAIQFHTSPNGCGSLA